VGQKIHENYRSTAKPATSQGGGTRRNINKKRENQTLPNYMTTTQNQTNRQQATGNENNFENRLKEMHINTSEQGSKLNTKVIETWINETLGDAEHLDIPGVIMKPDHMNPISRYQIDRLTLTNAGIPNELVDRIYRGLFVYSIGYYEML
jgi:hypothetical protein